MKQMLSVKDLIRHMKDKGITFNKISEADAELFLSNNNYYMKLASYRTNYEKYPSTSSKAGLYKCLDFAYLKEFSKIDMYLRYFIIEMTLDIEHAIKVKLVNKITNQQNEDGYQTVRKFLAEDENFRILKSIKRHDNGEYCKDLIDKYYPYFPVWVFVEIITFGDLLYFCNFYENSYKDKIVNHKLMNIVRDLRNASAHSNCILNHLLEKIDKTKQPDSEITNFLKTIPNISSTSRKNNTNYKFTYNFTVLLYVYNLLVSPQSKKNMFEKLKTFMDGRVVKHKDYFQNSKIKSIYTFLKKIIDKLSL